MESLTQLTSEEFLNKLASAEPVPGGGGAAALAGALAAALASMTANLTVGKEKFALQEEEYRSLLQKAEEARRHLLILVQEDADIFSKFMDCYKMPRQTEAEKRLRMEKISAAAQRAAEVPLNIARESMRVLQIASRLTVIGNSNVITDSAISVLFARAALRGAIYNVKVNLPLVKNNVFTAEINKEIADMEARSTLLEEEALKFTDNILS